MLTSSGNFYITKPFSFNFSFANADKGKICDSQDSDQCQMTSGSNNQHSINYIEECKEEGEPLNLSSCSKKYLTVDNLRFDPEFKFDTCTDTYVQAKQSVCMNTNDASICTVDLHGFVKSNPDCFRRYSMIIDYTCEGNVEVVTHNILLRRLPL